jgi:hypothetical protein
MTSTSFGIGELVHILGLGEKDPKKHVTVTDVYHHDNETHIVTVDGYGTRKTWSELDLRVASGRIPSDTARRTPVATVRRNPTSADVVRELERRGIKSPPQTISPTHAPSAPTAPKRTITPVPDDF